MVHIVDEGSHFDASIDQLWSYVQSDDEHKEAHKSRRNFHQKPLTENTFINSWEQDAQGRTVKISNKVTSLPPIGFAVEFLEGPMAGSKFFNFYTPQGNKTKVTVVGEFQSTMIPAPQLEPAVRDVLEQVFLEDTAALKHYSSKK